MKALSLWQPWASLIACGAKKIETRSWGTSYRGPIAIHAAKKWGPEQRGNAELLRVLLPRWEQLLSGALPLGEVVAIAGLVDVAEMTDSWIGEQTSTERICGGYAPGRFGWMLERVRPVFGLPLRGYQGLWGLDTLTAQEIERRAALLKEAS